MNRLIRFGSIALLACGLIIGTGSLSAQTIQRLISYQGLLTQPSGLPIADGNYGLVLRFYDAPTGGNLVYEEQQQTLVAKGLFNVLIGTSTPLANVDFNQQLWLETAITGQTPFLPRTRLAVVPYAIKAETAVVADSISDDASGFVRSLNGGQGDLTIKGEDGITVSRTGDTIYIGSTLISGGGIERITSTDNTIDVTNPAGPITDLGLADGAVTSTKIANGAVTNTKLGDNSVSTTKIQDASVTANKIAPGVIPTTLPPSGPAGGDLTGTYPNPLIAPDAVTSAKILDGQVATQDLANGSVTTSKIADGAVTTPKLADASVTTPKLADNSVTSSKLVNTTVVPGIYGSSLLIPRFEVDEDGRITSVQQVQIPDIPFTGPAGGDLTGTFPNPLIKAGAVTNTKLADASVSSSKLAGNSVTTDKIQNGTILAEDIAPGVIPVTLPPTGPAGGVLSGTYPNPAINQTEGTQLLNALNNANTTGVLIDARMKTTGVVAGTYGDGGNGKVPRLTVDAYGRLTGVIEQNILSATPTGTAGGDLQGTYPDPLINPSAAAGSRMVDAIRADYTGIPTDPDINTANNIVVLDGSGRLPAANGSLLTNLNASNISSGILPIVRGGTNSSAALNNNRIMISSGGMIVESAPIDAQTFLIGTSSTTLPTPGTITAGPGINVSFSAPNFVISNTHAKTLPGTANNQTSRWDHTFQQWVPNENLLATAAGDVTANGTLLVMGTGEIKGSTNIGSTPSAINRMGDASNTTNSMGSPTAENYLYGDTYINANTSSYTQIGNLSSSVSSTTINVGTDGNLQLNGIDTEPMFSFLGLNSQMNVRQSLASGLALEGLMWQNGAFRLGGTTPSINPFLQNRFVNLDVHRLSFTRLAGSNTMMYLDAGSGEINVLGPTNINTTLANTTTIGNPISLTTIGGQLDPRGDITNNVGNVRIVDQTEIIGPTYINIGTNDPVEIGNLSGTTQDVSISVGTSANQNEGNLYLHNIKTDDTPLYMLTENVSDRVRKKLLADMADEGIQYQNGAFRLGTGESTPNYLQEKSYDENRFVNLDQYSINYTTGKEGVDGITFVQFDGDIAGAPRVETRALTQINAVGPAATQIGNGTGNLGNVGIGEPAYPAGSPTLLTILGRPQTASTAFPDVRIDHLGGAAYNQLYVDNANNGVITGNVDGELVKWDENAFLDPFAWRVIGNTHAIVDGTNNLLGPQSADNIHFITGGTAAANYAMTIGSDRTIGIGTLGVGSGNYQVEIVNASASNGLSVRANGAGSIGASIDAADLGMGIGANATPINGIEIDAQAVGILLNANGTAPVVGISMDGSTTGLIIENAQTSIDAEGDVYLNDNYGGPSSVRINTGATNGPIQLATGTGAGSTVGIGQAPIGGYLLSVNGVAQSGGNTATPNVRIDHLGGTSLTTAYPNPDANNGILTADANGDMRKWDENTLIGTFAWLRTGNTIADGNNILGTLNNVNLDVRTNNINAMTVSAANQNVGIGIAPGATARLTVDNTIDLTGTDYNGGVPAYQIGGDNFLWRGPGNFRYSTFVGYTSNSVNSGHYVTAVGSFALANHQNGPYTTALGSFALSEHVSGVYNTAIGSFALDGNINGSGNTALGAGAGEDNTGSNNVFLGAFAGSNAAFNASSNVLAIDNSSTATPLIFGDFAANQLTFNVGTGAASLLVPGTAQTNAVATPNVRLAHLGGAALTTAYTNDANNGIMIADVNGDMRKHDEAAVVGSVAWLLGGNNAPVSNILGTTSATDIDIRTNNVNALTVSAANQNVGIGIAPGATARLTVDNTINVTGTDYNAGRPAYQLDGNNFLWEGAGGTQNTFVGVTSNSTVSGTYNTAIGFDAMRAMTTGVVNTALGAAALYSHQTGRDNLASGYGALYSNVAGDRNTSVGSASGWSNTGSANTFLGMYTGASVTGDGNVILGHQVGLTAFASPDNNLAIHNANVSNPLVFGSFSSRQLTFNVATTAASLLVPGTAQTAAAATPNVRLAHLGGQALTTAYTDNADNGIMIADVNGDMRKYDEAAIVGSVAWLLGGNNAPVSNILGTTSATDIDIRTNNTTRFTLTSAGALTQTGTGAITFFGNTGIGETADATFALTVDGTGGTPNVRMRSLDANGAAYNPATDGIVVADATGAIRRTPLPGELIFGRRAATLPKLASAGVTADPQMAATTGSAGEFEIEVYIMYSGTNFPFSALDFNLTSSVVPTSISYGVVSSGQAVSPSNVDGNGAMITNIGVASVPGNRQTILVKGYIDLPSGATVTLHWGDGNDAAGESITVHANSYIKLTRNQ